MTVSRTDMLSAFDSVNHVFIDVLSDWLTNEANNLQGFINSPEEHAEYNPYITPDFTALQSRVDMLNQCASNLNIISQYKQGANVTGGQYETALDSIPHELFQRLYEWMLQRKVEMDNFLNNSNKNKALSPLSDYSSMFTFNQTKYESEYQLYVDGLSGLSTSIQYKIENGQ